MPLVREGVPAHDRLVVLHGERGRRGNQLRSAGQHPGFDAGPERQHIVAGFDRHHDLFERGVARALADAVDGAFNLPRTRLDARKRISHGHAEVVMAMDGKDGLV